MIRLTSVFAAIDTLVLAQAPESARVDFAQSLGAPAVLDLPDFVALAGSKVAVLLATWFEGQLVFLSLVQLEHAKWGRFGCWKKKDSKKVVVSYDASVRCL